MPHIWASFVSPCCKASFAVFLCDIAVALSWKDVYMVARYGLLQVPKSYIIMCVIVLLDRYNN